MLLALRWWLMPLAFRCLQLLEKIFDEPLARDFETLLVLVYRDKDSLSILNPS